MFGKLKSCLLMAFVVTLFSTTAAAETYCEDVLVTHPEDDLCLWAIQVTEVVDYVDTWYDQWYDKKWKKKARANAKRDFAVPIVDISNKYGVDPLLTAVIVAHESGFKMDARSSVGAVGLMQNKGVSMRDCDMKTAEGQIECGVKWLVAETERCGSLLSGMNAYQTKGGKCGPILSVVQSRYDAYQEVVDDGSETNTQEERPVACVPGVKKPGMESYVLGDDSTAYYRSHCHYLAPFEGEQDESCEEGPGHRSQDAQ